MGRNLRSSDRLRLADGRIKISTRNSVWSASSLFGGAPAEPDDRLRHIERQIGEIRELVISGHSEADILVAVYAAREVLAWFGRAVIGDDITEELATTAASEDPNTRSQRLEALLDLLPYVAF